MSLLLNSATAKTTWDVDPRTIPDCRIWFDAADTSTLTLDGTTVKAWKNKGSIDMNAIQDTGTCTSGGTINGRNFIACPGGTMLGFTCALTTQPRSWFVVARCTTQLTGQTGAAFWGPVNQSAGAGQQAIVVSRAANATNVSYPTDTGPSGFSGISAGNGPNPFNQVMVYAFVQSSTSTADNAVTINGTSSITVTNLAANYNINLVRYVINTAGYSTGADICEILHYSRALTVLERQSLEGYLMWKWGLKRQDEVGFVPTSISNCALWYDADVNFANTASRETSFTFSSGDSVNVWKDKSGNSRDATFLLLGSSTTRPLLTASRVNGKCAVVFNGTNALASSYSLPTTQAHTLFVVAGPNANGFRSVISLNARPGTRGQQLNVYVSGANTWWYSGGDVGTDGTTVSIPYVSNRYDILAFYWSTTLRTQMNINGHFIPSSTASPASLRADSTLLIGSATSGASSTPVELFSGGIAEIILYTAILTVDQRNRVERYLSLKWNRPLINACALGHPNKMVPPFNQTFSPTAIVGCSLWLDAADSATVAVDGTGNVSQWDDKSGNGLNAVQATPSRQPKASGGGISFAGISQFLQVTSPAIRPAQLFVVARATAASGVLLQKGFAAATDLEFSLNTTATDVRALYNLTTGTSGTATLLGGVNLATTVLYEATWTGTTIALLINGTEQATTALSGTQRTASTGATDLRIGADFSSSSNTSTPSTLWTGIIYEILCYTGALSTGDRQRVEGYLATKWNIQQLLPKSAPAFNGAAITTPASFIPTQVSDLRVWYDASDPTTIVGTVPGLVNEWRDKSGNGLHMIARPTFGTARIAMAFQNGLDVLNCNGNTVYEAAAGSAVYPVDAYVVIALKAPLTRCDVFAMRAPTGTDNFNSLTYGETTPFNRWQNGSTTATRLVQSPVVETSANFLILNWSLANNNYVLRRNGTTLVLNTTRTFTLTANSVFQIGYRNNLTPDVNLNAYIAEIVTYSRQLGITERQNVETYLATKWDLRSSLPSSHPGYYVQPNRVVENFLPTSISGCHLWVDASDRTTINGGTITVGGTVIQWNDKSGNGNNLTAGGSPIWDYSLNRLPGITTTTGRFTRELSPSLISFRNTTFIVTQYNANPTSGYPCVSIGNASSGSTRWMRCLDWATTVRASAFFAANAHATITAPGITTPFLWTSFYDGDTALVARLNAGSTTGSAIPASPGSPATFVNVGCETLTTLTTTNTWPGVISEIIIYNSVLSPTNRSIVESYLARKWGLTRLALTENQFINPGAIPNSPRFFPTSFNGLVLWLDATDPYADGVPPASGTALSRWTDKSTTLASFTTATTPVPTYTASLINSLPGVDMTNSSGFISTATQTLTSSLTFAMVVVVKSGIGTWAPFFTHGSRDLDFSVERNAGGTTLQFQSGNDNSGANLTYTTDQVALYLGTMTTGTSRFFSRFGGGTTNTAIGTNTSTITPGLQTIRVGINDAGDTAKSFIGEIVYYNRVLSTSERQTLEGYLAWKWGGTYATSLATSLVDSLPTSHPYKKFSP